MFGRKHQSPPRDLEDRAALADVAGISTMDMSGEFPYHHTWRPDLGHPDRMNHRFTVYLQPNDLLSVIGSINFEDGAWVGRVNWSALGPRLTMNAKQYARMIQYAAEIVEGWLAAQESE